MRLVVDVENTVTKRDGRNHIDPFEPGNTLTMVGLLNADDPEEMATFALDHTEYQDNSGMGRKTIQAVLDQATLLIMHNAQHDLPKDKNRLGWRPNGVKST